jgi:hypothetical protein
VLGANTEVCLETHTDKTKHICISLHQNKGKNCDMIKRATKSRANVDKFYYFEECITKIYIVFTLFTETAYLVTTILFWRPLSQNAIVCCDLQENHVLKKKSGYLPRNVEQNCENPQ